MADLVDIARVRIHPLLSDEVQYPDATISTYISAVSDIIIAYCDKYLPNVDTVSPRGLVQQACVMQIALMLLQDTRDPGVLTESVKDLDQTFGREVLAPQVRDLLQLAQSDNGGVVFIDDNAPQQLDIWANPTGGLNPWNPFNETPR